MGDLGMDVQVPAAAALARPPYPERLADQSAAIRQVLVLADRALSADQVAAAFSGVQTGAVDELLELLVMMGQVRQVGTELVAYAA